MQPSKCHAFENSSASKSITLKANRSPGKGTILSAVFVRLPARFCRLLTCSKEVGDFRSIPNPALEATDIDRTCVGPAKLTLKSCSFCQSTDIEGQGTPTRSLPGGDASVEWGEELRCSNEAVCAKARDVESQVLGFRLSGLRDLSLQWDTKAVSPYASILFIRSGFRGTSSSSTPDLSIPSVSAGLTALGPPHIPRKIQPKARLWSLGAPATQAAEDMEFTPAGSHLLGTRTGKARASRRRETSFRKFFLLFCELLPQLSKTMGR